MWWGKHVERGCCADSELKRRQGAERTAGAPSYSRGGSRGVRCHDGQVGHGIREKERSQRAWPEQLGKWSCLFLNQGKFLKEHVWGQRWVGAWLWVSYVCDVCWTPKWCCQQEADWRVRISNRCELDVNWGLSTYRWSEPWDWLRFLWEQAKQKRVWDWTLGVEWSPVCMCTLATFIWMDIQKHSLFRYIQTHTEGYRSVVLYK